ncbi:mCG1027210 [Mus musculus]|nr:mCG1027210 [Mus musculus]
MKSSWLPLFFLPHQLSAHKQEQQPGIQESVPHTSFLQKNLSNVQNSLLWSECRLSRNECIETELLKFTWRLHFCQPVPCSVQ